MAKVNLQDEIRRITNETAASAASKALEVAELAKQKAAEVSTLAIAEALKAATLAATKAADAASAAATIAASTSKDLEYIKKDIADTKADVKEIKDKLDNKYVTKEEFSIIKSGIAQTETKVDGRSDLIAQIPTIKAIVYGMVSVILLSVISGLMYILIHKP